jgi:hypothetical protein
MNSKINVWSKPAITTSVKDTSSCFLSCGATTQIGPRPPLFEVSYITLRHTTFGWGPLDEWSVRRREHLICSVRYSVVPIKSSLLTRTLYSSVRTTLVYNDIKYSVPFMILEPSSTIFTLRSYILPRTELQGGFLWKPYVPQRNDGIIYIYIVISWRFEEAGSSETLAGEPRSVITQQTTVQPCTAERKLKTS